MNHITRGSMLAKQGTMGPNVATDGSQKGPGGQKEPRKDAKAAARPGGPAAAWRTSEGPSLPDPRHRSSQRLNPFCPGSEGKAAPKRQMYR